MTRLLRLEFPGAIYHLTARGTGRSAFLAKLSPYLKEKAAVSEIPCTQRFAVRPPLERILPRVRSTSERDLAITEAHLEHGYSQAEIAAHVGLHDSTASRIIQRERGEGKKQDLTRSRVEIRTRFSEYQGVIFCRKKTAFVLTEGSPSFIIPGSDDDFRCNQSEGL